MNAATEAAHATSCGTLSLIQSDEGADPQAETDMDEAGRQLLMKTIFRGGSIDEVAEAIAR
jgi:hypothetical protein